MAEPRLVQQETGYCTTDAAAGMAVARARRERSRRTAELPPPDEAGTDGPAMADRPRRAEVLPGDARIGREQVRVERYLDAHVIDRMRDRGQLSDDQHGAAARLYALFCRAGLEPGVVGLLGKRMDNDCAEMDDAVGEARAEYNRLIARHPGRTGELLDSLCHGRHPGTFFVAALQGALDELARAWPDRRRAPPD